ncbi:MAG: hypothetical protein ABEK04_02330 [Candidatus Nanohalobium sp.]
MKPGKLKNYAAAFSLLLFVFMLSNGAMYTWKAFQAGNNIGKAATGQEIDNADERAEELWKNNRSSYSNAMSNIKVALSYFILSIIPGLAARRTDGFHKLKILIYRVLPTSRKIE